MGKLYAILFSLILSLVVVVPARAIEYPSDFFDPFPSFPFPSKTPKASSTPTPSPSVAPSSAPIPTVLEITDVDPSSANFMEEFVVYGTNFGSSPGGIGFRASNQSFLSAGAPIVSWSDTQIHAKVPAVRKGSYRIHVITAGDQKSNEVRFSVRNGQPIINSTSLRIIDGEYELIFQGQEFGSRRGSIDIYSGDSLAGNGIIRSWSSSRVRFELPNLPNAEYGFQITTSDGRKSSFKYFTVGN